MSLELISEDNIAGYYSDNDSVFIRKQKNENKYRIIISNNNKEKLFTVDEVSYLGSLKNHNGEITGDTKKGITINNSKVVVFVSVTKRGTMRAEVDW